MFLIGLVTSRRQKSSLSALSLSSTTGAGPASPPCKLNETPLKCHRGFHTRRTLLLFSWVFTLFTFGFKDFQYHTHVCKPAGFWAACLRALLISSQMLHRCSVQQQTWAACSRLCRQHGHAFSAPDVCFSAGPAHMLWLLLSALIQS